MQKVINNLLHSPYLRDSMYYKTTYRDLEWDKPPMWIETKKGTFYPIQLNITTIQAQKMEKGIMTPVSSKQQ